MIRKSFAVVSDIHGNRWALEAVLEDIDKRNIKSILNLGDSLYGPLDPAGTASILMKMDVISVCGNEDRIIFEPSGSANLPSPTLLFVRESLSELQIRWLKKQNKTVSVDNRFLCFHGTPEDDQQYLLHDVSKNGLIQRKDHELERLLSGHNEKILFCGHDHLPAQVNLSGIRKIVNPGSVGLQAYTDDYSFYHKVENGDPRARYCVVKEEDFGVRIEQITLSYDFHTASGTAFKNSRPDWAHWLKTGYAE